MLSTIEEIGALNPNDFGKNKTNMKPQTFKIGQEVEVVDKKHNFCGERGTITDIITGGDLGTEYEVSFSAELYDYFYENEIKLFEKIRTTAYASKKNNKLIIDTIQRRKHRSSTNGRKKTR